MYIAASKFVLLVINAFLCIIVLCMKEMLGEKSLTEKAGNLSQLPLA